MSLVAATPLSPDYIRFLKKELEILRSFDIPREFYSRDSKRDTLRFCLSEITLQRGFVAEFGVHKGDSVRIIADSLPNMLIHGFDSFEGFPDDGRTDWQSDFSLNGLAPAVPTNVTLHKGFFSESIPGFLLQLDAEAQAALIHIDCDIYSSTSDVLRLLSARIRSGTLIVFDELLHYSGCLHNELLAFYEFVTSHSLRFEWVGIRGKVLPIDGYFNPPPELSPLPLRMRDWRVLGYEQAVAVRIL